MARNHGGPLRHVAECPGVGLIARTALATKKAGASDSVPYLSRPLLSAPLILCRPSTYFIICFCDATP